MCPPLLIILNLCVSVVKLHFSLSYLCVSAVQCLGVLGDLAVQLHLCEWSNP